MTCGKSPQHDEEELFRNPEVVLCDALIKVGKRTKEGLDSPDGDLLDPKSQYTTPHLYVPSSR